MDKFYIGTHISDIYEIKEYLPIIKEVGGNCIQTFLTLTGKTSVEKYNNNELIEIKNYLINNKFKLVIHSSYMHNLARDWDEYSWWIINIISELEIGEKLGAFGLVIHFGKKLDLTTEQAYNNMYSSLIYIHNKTKDLKIKIILETSTGQGSEICYKIEDLSYFFKKLSKNKIKSIRSRFKICIDTCHIFSAGYNIRTKYNIRQYIETFNELIGIKNIYLIHLNDCKVDIGMQVDRHQNIGKGYIGYEGLKYFFDIFKKYKIPIILETPNNGFLKEIPKLINNF